MKTAGTLIVSKDNQEGAYFDLYSYLLQKEKYTPFVNHTTVKQKVQFTSQDVLSHRMVEVIVGAVKVVRFTGEGETLFSDILEKGDFYGNLYPANETYYEYLVPLVDSRIRTYHLPYFRQQITSDPVVAAWYGALMSACHSKMKTRLLHLATTRVKVKIEFVRKALNKKVEDVHGKSQHLMDLLSVSEIAQFAGTTRQTASQFLSRKRR